MTFRGRPIATYRTPRSGLSYTDAYARLEAARWAGYQRVEDFADLDLDAQARIIAHYETAMQIQAVLQQDAQQRANQR